MFSVKISSVKGISISKTRPEFFNLKWFRGVESKIQAGIVNARIKNFNAVKKTCNRARPRPVTTCKEETINHVHRNLGVETLQQLFQTAFGSGASRPTGKNAGVFVGLATSQLDER
jgi:hypothetical protein